MGNLKSCLFSMSVTRIAVGVLSFLVEVSGFLLTSFPRARIVMEVFLCAQGSGVQKAQGCSKEDSSGDFAPALSSLS